MIKSQFQLTDEEIERIKNRFEHSIVCKRVGWGSHKCNCARANTIKLIDELERLRNTLKFKTKEDEDVLKVAVHRLEAYKQLIKYQSDKPLCPTCGKPMKNAYDSNWSGR